MRSYLERAYDRVTRTLPPDVAGRIDLVRPSYRNSWGGPLNGQERRRDILRELAQAVRFDRVIETGTYRGTSTEFFSAVFGCPVETVERNPRFYAYSRRRLSVLPSVRVVQGDSRTFLRDLAGRDAASAETVLIYLDAHWEEDLPLAEELRIIGPSWPDVVVMIDDFEVPGEPGYQFDDYGFGKALTESYLPAESLPGWTLLYPSAGAARETGAKRGCVVLASPSLGGLVRAASSLRVGTTF
jgi:predicted O-methyltransferase YrrM